MEDRIGKADAAVQDQVFLEQHHETRDERGRFDVGTFARMAAASQKLKDAQPPVKRVQRIQRTQRTQLALKPTQNTQQSSTQAAAQVSSQNAAQLVAQVSAKTRFTQDEPRNDKESDFYYLDSDQMDEIVNNPEHYKPVDIPGMSRPSQVQLAPGSTDLSIFDNGRLNVAGLKEEMVGATDDRLLNALNHSNPRDSDFQLVTADHSKVDLNGEEVDEVQKALSDFFSRSLSVTDVQMDLIATDDPNQYGVRFRGFHKASRPTVIVDHVENHEAPIILYKAGNTLRSAHGPLLPPFIKTSSSKDMDDSSPEVLSVSWWTRLDHDLYIASNTKPRDTA